MTSDAEEGDEMSDFGANRDVISGDFSFTCIGIAVDIVGDEAVVVLLLDDVDAWRSYSSSCGGASSSMRLGWNALPHPLDALRGRPPPWLFVP